MESGKRRRRERRRRGTNFVNLYYDKFTKIYVNKIYCGDHFVVQLTLEEDKFEMCGFTYTCIFFY